jgi:transposase
MMIFPDQVSILIEQISVADEITLTLRTMSPTASCPNCGTLSTRVQSRYSRTLHDLPSTGRPVDLIVHVRRFFCTKSTCAQKIFAERLPELCHPHAQRTIRLQEALSQLGLVVGGQAGARVGSQLGFSGSRDTILRLLRQSDLPEPRTPHVVGVDEWAWKRGRRYGTLLCDLERGIPIDVLPDRSVESVSAWFKRHPSIEVVSRDRSSEFAAAASQGAPQAVQVADRWHVGKNLAEALSTVLARCRADQAKANHAKVKREESLSEPPPQRAAYRSKGEEQVRLARKAEREQRYAQVLALHQQGLGAIDIAARVGMGERTIRRWLACGSYPEPKRRRRRPSLIDRYENMVLNRWDEGCRNGARLYQELRQQGYRGSQKALYRYLARLRPVGSTRRRQAAGKEEAWLAGPLERLSTGRSTWLFMRKSEDLSQEEHKELTRDSGKPAQRLRPPISWFRPFSRCYATAAGTIWRCGYKRRKRATCQSSSRLLPGFDKIMPLFLLV